MPPKAVYLEMETTDLEFEFYLADRLSMTVARLRLEMPAAEYIAWSVYYGRKAQRMEIEQAKRR
jgi:allophanate hydrolase subunit 2